jgi:hypothetical protein
MISDYGKPWTKQADDQLNTLYNVDMLNIMEISKINNRSPCLIVKRLTEKKHIESYNFARGYADYIKTPEYRKYVDYMYSGLGGGTAYSN